MQSYDRVDTRIKFSIGSQFHSGYDGEFSHPAGVAFDHHRGLLFAVDCLNHRVQVFSSNDGSFVAKFGSEGNQPGQLYHPYGIAIDHDQDRILVTDRDNDRLQSWSLPDFSLSCVGHEGSSDFLFKGGGAGGVTVDHHHHRIIVVDTRNHRLIVLSSIDLSFLFVIDGNNQREFCFPAEAAIDHDRDRIIVTDSGNHRIQVLSSIDGSFLFEFGSLGNQPGQIDGSVGLCIINQSRIIIADSDNHRLQAFTSEGHHISSFDCGDEEPLRVAFDPHRGLIAFSPGRYHQVHVIGANQWLPDTFEWRPDRHLDAPESIKQALLTMTMIRSLVDESSVSLLPNEILFLIFEML